MAIWCKILTDLLMVSWHPCLVLSIAIIDYFLELFEKFYAWIVSSENVSNPQAQESSLSKNAPSLHYPHLDIF